MMDKYREFKNRKILTVGQLIEKLKRYPPDCNLSSTGADLGGYDVSSANYIDVTYNEKDNTISFSHMEYEMYEAYEKELITYKQFKELNDEK